MTIRPYLDQIPSLGARVYVDPAATVIGQVTFGDDVSIWPGCVVRGDVNFIRIGARSNIQDGTVIHVSHDGPHARLGGFATVIGDVVLGDDVSIWPGTIVRGDVNFIRIGARTNIQDGTVVHVSHDGRAKEYTRAYGKHRRHQYRRTRPDPVPPARP